MYELAAQCGRLEEVLAAPRRPQRRRPAAPGPGLTVYFKIEGMWCAGCAIAARRILEHQAGVIAAEVSFAAGRGRLRLDPGRADPEAALQGLDALGYRAQLVADVAEERADRRQDSILVQLLVAVGFGMNVMALYLNQLYHYYAAGQYNTPQVRGFQYLVFLSAIPVFVVGGNSFPRGAWRALRARMVTMDTLVTMGLFASFGYSTYMTLTGQGQTYFDSVVMIVVFLTVGRAIEMSGAAQAHKDVRKLLRLQPLGAQRRTGDGWQDVAARELAAGDIVLVRPGERAPADAQVVEGEAAADESLLTGESTPVSKGPGDSLFAGTLLTDSALVCRVTQAPRNARLSQIIRLVEETLTARPPIQRLADQVSGYLALGILAVAVVTALGWRVAGHAPADALLAAVAVLVVACPCALGLATPLALSAVLGAATRRGILVRNPAALETAAGVQCIAFDKTGTLTRGKMEVAAAAAAPDTGMSRDGLLGIAAAVEQFSEHPVARAVVTAAPGRPGRTRGFRARRGLGASASLGDGRRVSVGSLPFLEAEADPAMVREAEVRAALGETVVWVGVDHKVCGWISLRDGLNPTAAEALQELTQAGVRTVLLSGDSPLTAATVAAELGMREHEGRCSPADKAARIQAWQKAGARVAMVGDGVNDAPALAQADLSITVAGGTDVAGGVSDVVLTRADLALIPELMRLSQRARRTIRQNLTWAFAYNLVAVPLAAIGVITPAIAAATMAASSLLVVGNSLRLRR